LLFGIVLVVFVTPGCGPSVSEEELGTVIYDAQQLPGADRPYALPEPPVESAPERTGQPADDA
jgi:hypothetical protein